MRGAVDMRAEFCTLLGKLSVVGERKYLKAAAVGEQRACPPVEFVQTTGLGYYLHAGPQIEVIGIAKYDFGVDIVGKFMLMHPLDRAEGSYRHEYWGRNLAVVGGDDAGAGI